MIQNAKNCEQNQLYAVWCLMWFFSQFFHWAMSPLNCGSLICGNSIDASSFFTTFDEIVEKIASISIYCSWTSGYWNEIDSPLFEIDSNIAEVHSMPLLIIRDEHSYEHLTPHSCWYFSYVESTLQSLHIVVEVMI